MSVLRRLILMMSVLLASCAQQGRPVSASDYELPTLAPQMADDLILVEKKIFDHPAMGTMLRYLDQSNPSDSISVYIYPINQVSWDNELTTIEAELYRSLAEIDQAVKHGHYKSRKRETVSDFSVKAGHKTYVGMKAQLDIYNQLDHKYYSDIFVFVDKDKFIKFRTSFNGEQSHFWTGDDIVFSILPKLRVPPESNYMRQLRNAHREKLERQLMDMLTKQASEAPN